MCYTISGLRQYLQVNKKKAGCTMTAQTKKYYDKYWEVSKKLHYCKPSEKKDLLKLKAFYDKKLDGKLLV